MNKINLYSTVTEILDKKNSWNNHNINLYSTLTETFDKKIVEIIAICYLCGN